MAGLRFARPTLGRSPVRRACASLTNYVADAPKWPRSRRLPGPRPGRDLPRRPPAGPPHPPLGAAGLRRQRDDAGGDARTPPGWCRPPGRSGCPAARRTRSEMRGTVAMRTLYLAPVDDRRAAGGLPRPGGRAAAARADPAHRAHRHAGRGRPGATTRLEGLLVDLLAAGETAPLDLPLPTDPRARRLRRAPAGRARRTRRRWPTSRAGPGASLRTLQRLFLARDRPVAGGLARPGAHAAGGGVAERRGAGDRGGAGRGYQSPSAFIAAFKRAVRNHARPV